MPMLRSGTSTLSMMQRRTTKYQKFLNLSNVFLLITATILIFSAVVLIKFYHVDKLSFWSTYFTFVPFLMIVLGVYTFLVCVVGFLISGTENRLLLAIYAVLLSVAFLLQLVSIFSSLELRTVISQVNVHKGIYTSKSIDRLILHLFSSLYSYNRLQRVMCKTVWIA